MTDAYGESRGWFIGGQATQSRSGRWVSKACTSGNTTLHWSPFPLPPRETMVGPTATAVLSKSVVKVPEKGLRWVSGGGFLLRRRQRSEEGSTENQSICRPRWCPVGQEDGKDPAALGPNEGHEEEDEEQPTTKTTTWIMNLKFIAYGLLVEMKWNDSIGMAKIATKRLMPEHWSGENIYHHRTEP
ncbi:hypothetical protein RJ640_001781 [Escallonia rubra]|uniref:Uncharacterized protein n=1 Tax=Escallonia rubra TaxID=112253 RepID=A0AA88QM86_9ASTE|nr:hypothetical protein RJ640_001781 [Escallonia rubra]